MALWVWFVGNAGIRGAVALAPDFEYFYKAGDWLLRRGVFDPGYDVTADGRVLERGRLEWYLPAVSRVMTLVAAVPLPLAGLMWFGLNVAATFALLRLIGRRLVGLPPQDWPVTQLVPLLLLTVFWHWEFRLNQTDVVTLLLLVGSFVAWERGRAGLAGFWLGLAVLLKVTPLLCVVWFALKRQFRTVAAALLTLLLAGPGGDVAVFGYANTLAEYRGWLRNVVTEGSHRGHILAQTEMDWRNQGMGAVLCRWLHSTNYTLQFDNDPRLAARAGLAGQQPPATLNLANLSPTTVAAVVTTVQAASLAGLVWLARRPAGKLPLWRVRFEWALFVLGMLWFMPVMRAYHLIWALPALSLLAAGVHHLGRRRRWSAMALVSMFALIPAQIAVFWPPAAAAGVLLWTVALLATPLVLMILRLGRDPAALPADYYLSARGPDNVAGRHAAAVLAGERTGGGRAGDERTRGHE